MQNVPLKIKTIQSMYIYQLRYLWYIYQQLKQRKRQVVMEEEEFGSTPGIGPVAIVSALLSMSCDNGCPKSFPITFCALHSSSGHSSISIRPIDRFFGGGAPLSTSSSPSVGCGAALGISGFPGRSIIFPLYDFRSFFLAPVTGSCRATDSAIDVRLYSGNILVVGWG